MKHDKLTRLILAALFAALTCAATMLIHIPMPATNGYINLGDCVVLLSAFFLGPVYGMAAGGIGAMLADLLLGWQDEGRARPAWTYSLFARVFGDQFKK